MRILHILDHSVPLHSGYSFRTLAILRTQRSFGWETEQLTSAKQDTTQAEEEVDGFRFYRTSRWGGPLARLPVLGQVSIIGGLRQRLIHDIIPRTRPDVLHAHSPSLTGVAALQAARRYKLPVVYEVRALWEDGAVDHGTARPGGLRYRMTRALESYVLHRADAVTTICEGLRGEIVGRGVNPDRVTVIPNAVDATAFSMDGSADSELLTSLGWRGAKLIGFIGSFYAYEGLSLLLEALPRILACDPSVRLLLVGGGPEEGRLKQQAADLGLELHVCFAGRVPQLDVAAFYDVMDVLVYPRLPVRVTELVTPLKPLEAMAKGRLVVASDVGGHKELIQDGTTGLLFRAGSAESLAEAVLNALETRRAPEIRATARRYVETNRTWVASVRQYEAVYSRVMEKRAATVAP